MKRCAVSAVAALLLSGCATIERFGTVDNFVKCASADVITTAFGLSTGSLVERNPLTRALTIGSLGKVAGTVVPVIALSIAAYYALKRIDAPKLTQTVTVLTCAAAVHNAYLVVRTSGSAAAGAGPVFPVHGPMIRPLP